MEIVWSVGIILMILVCLPCLLLRPLFLAIADRIAGKKSNAKELNEMKERISRLESDLRSLQVHLINVESNQEFSNKLLENLKKDNEKTDE